MGNQFEICERCPHPVIIHAPHDQGCRDCSCSFLKRGKTSESCACPYCHQVFYAPPLHDPIRKHVEYCEANPETQSFADTFAA